MTSRRSLYLALLLLLGASAWAQRFKPAVPTDADAAELVSAGKDPVIRYPVAHFHLGRVGCAGYLYFSRNTVRYEVLSPESDATHGFDRPRSEIISVGEWHQMGAATNALELKFPTGPPYHFLRVRKQWVQTGRSGGLEALPYE